MSHDPVYQRDPEMRPDSEFEPGTLRHLVAGNTGRLLDARRTPVSVTAVLGDSAMFSVRIDGFEDRGAVWTLPFEEVSNFQFAPGATVSSAEVERFAATVERFDRPWHVAAEADARRHTVERLEAMAEEAGAWLEAESEFLREGGVLPDPGTRAGDPRLWRDLRAYWPEAALGEMEEVFARQFVSNPYSGELVKGHRVVLAELGLVAFEGKPMRLPDVFAGTWSKERRAAHICRRLAFVRALFGLLGVPAVTLFRGISAAEPLAPPRNDTFVSATFDQAVAEAHFEAVAGDAHRRLLRREVPVERLFMTYYETEAMSRVFKEAEAVVLFDPATPGL